MTLSYFEELLAEFGAKTVKRIACGAARGYAFSAELTQDAAHDLLLVNYIVDGPARPAARALNQKKIPYTKWRALPAKAGGTLQAAYSPPSDFYAKSGIYTILAQAALALAEAGLAPPVACPLCGLENCDRYALLDNTYRPTHAACLQARLVGEEEDVQPPRRVKGRALTGILGALLGAFIGILPIWALAMSQTRLSWALYVFIPFFAGLCYRLCRGKANAPLAGVSVLGASLLWTLVLEQVWYWLYLTSTPPPEGFGRNLPFSFTVSRYFQTHTFAVTLNEMWLSLLALVLGFVAITFFLRRYAAEGSMLPPMRYGKKTIRATALPMDGTAGNTPAKSGSESEMPAPADEDASEESCGKG